jgi:hypothetical protein
MTVHYRVVSCFVRSCFSNKFLLDYIKMLLLLLLMLLLLVVVVAVVVITTILDGPTTGTAATVTPRQGLRPGGHHGMHIRQLSLL